MRTKKKHGLIIAAIITLSLSIPACGSQTPPEPAVEANTITQPTEVIVEPVAQTVEPVAQGEPGTWLIMMYEDADDETLEQDMVIDVNEAELVGSTDQVKIVVQLDRYAGGYDGQGNVTSTKRYLLTQDDNLDAINSEELADLGEVDMGDPNSLFDFATWAMRSFPSEHYVLILSDHGQGWPGGWLDNEPQPGSQLYMQNIDNVLGAVLTNTGVDAFELVGFDACLMGQLEVMSAIAPHARYAVGSEEIEPGFGWAYSKFLQALNENTAMTGGDLGQAIVDSYIGQDIRITDDRARQAFFGNVSAKEVADYESSGVTLSTINLSVIQDLNAAVNELAVALTGVDQGIVAQARAYSQSYESIYKDLPPSFIDLGSFVALLLESIDDPSVVQAAQNIESVLGRAVIAEKHGPERSGSTGMSIFFPNKQVYALAFDNTEYTFSVGRFATASLWDDFLTFHYNTSQTFDPASADLSVLTPAYSTQTDFSQAAEESAPESGAEIVAPGAGQFTIAPITVSANQISTDGVITLSTVITGLSSNIAYVYYYVSYYEESDGSFLTADEGYVEPGDTKEIGGVYYPDWGNQDVTSVEYDWEPTLFYMSDGNEANDQFAFFEPTIYGADTAGDIYTVRGTYTFADTGTEIDAEIDFNGEGDMQSIWGFVDLDNGSGTWHEITPQPGDTFNITDEYLEFEQNPEGEFVDYEGGTMTFGNTPFTMVPYYADPGSYMLGIGVEDLDGNISWEFIEVTVTE